MWMQSFLIWGGAHNRLCPSLARRLYHRLTSTANARRFVPVPDLTIALVDATSLERPVRTSRWLQPTLNYFWGGVLRQLPSRWRERPHLVARWCRLLRLAGRHLILPPSNPLHSMKELFILPGEGTPIHSMPEDFLFLRGSECDASTDHIVLAGVINLAIPINLLDGLRWGGGIYCFGAFLWKISSLFFWYFSVDCWIQFFWIICLVVSLGLFVHLPLFFRFHFGSAT